jgi:hypothetical protein
MGVGLVQSVYATGLETKKSGFDFPFHSVQTGSGLPSLLFIW